MTVFMFPGQGAQKPGMGADLLGIAEVAQTFAIAGEVCGVDVAALAREGSAEQVTVRLLLRQNADIHLPHRNTRHQRLRQRLDSLYRG